MSTTIRVSFSVTVCIICLWLPATIAISQPLTILTYNIRYANSHDGNNNWEERRTWLCSQITHLAPDIFGIQEGLVNQVHYIDSVCSDFDYIGKGRDDGKKRGEFSAIFYHSEKFNLLKQSTFWLSSTPGKPSIGWDAALERICTCGLFREIRTGRKFWVFNTHFDHLGSNARLKSAELILRKIKSLNKEGFPVILMGDFNAGPESAPIRLITQVLQDSKIADKSMTMEPEGTFNGFDPLKPATERIDFIFTSISDVSVLNYGVLRESRQDRFASDHYPVAATILFK